MNNDWSGGMQKVHSTRYIQGNSDTARPWDLHSIVLRVFVIIDSVMKEIEEITVMAVLRDQADGVHHQSHEENNVGMAECTHENDLTVEITNCLCRHARNS